MTSPTLSTINPDFNDIANQLKNSLRGKSTWRALLEVDTGSIIVEAVAATGTLLMTAVQNALEEGNPDSARLDSSLKAIARSLGVRLQRKSPGGCTVNLTIPAGATTVFTVPAYTQFSASGKKLFNRAAFVFPVGVTSLSVPLYEGLVQNVQFYGTGNPGQIYTINVPGFTISDRDVSMTADNVPVIVVTDSLWHYPNPTGINTAATRVVQDRTLPTGELELLFGNTLFGYNPPNASTIILQYVVTNGALGNDLAFLGQRVTMDTNNTVTGLATSILNNGANEPEAEVYRNSPLLYASYGRAVSINDYETLSLQYENVVDARFFGQQLIAPNVKEFMNVVYVYLLQSDNTQMDAGEFTNFKAWLQPRAIPLEYVRKLAVAIPIDISANISIRNTGDPETVKSNVQKSVEALFKPTDGFLGRNLYLSDVYDAIKDADPSIDFLQLLSPTSTAICRIEPPKLVTLAGVSVTGLGLTEGTTYTYAVSALNSQGETFASQLAQIVLPVGMNGVALQWDAVPGATGYAVYGNIDTDMRKLGPTLGPGVTSFTDDATFTPGTPINLVNTSGLYYVTLNSTLFNISYTTRKA